MVNDKVVNGFMKKKEYIIPLISVEQWNMREVMKASGTSPELPPDLGGGAPARRTKVF